MIPIGVVYQNALIIAIPFYLLLVTEISFWFLCSGRFLETGNTLLCTASQWRSRAVSGHRSDGVLQHLLLMKIDFRDY
ncbi:MAG: hypothetical protein IJU92_02815 [Spirochaetaceae bacterium]|nr:hypothetical protein [Spirochaetaceae bacterium]